MSIKAEIFGGTDGEKMDIIKENGWSGPPVFTEPLRDFDYFIRPLLNQTFGAEMAQNVTFGGTPELIFDGGSGGTEWSGSGNAQWNFADSGKVTVTNGTDNSVALFEDAGTIAIDSYTALTGKVDLDTYTPSTQDVLFQFRLAGTPLGNSVSMNNYIDVNNFTEQSFSVPLGDFGLAGQTVDEFIMTISRSSGPTPDISFDDFQIEETGSPATFSLEPDRGTRLHMQKFTLSFTDAFAGTLADGTMPALSYNKILGINALANGINIRTQSKGKPFFATTSRQMSDFLTGGGKIETAISDGTNAMVVIEISFAEPIILDSKYSDITSFTISDDLSGLISFQTLVIGKVEQIDTNLA